MAWGVGIETGTMMIMTDGKREERKNGTERMGNLGNLAADRDGNLSRSLGIVNETKHCL